MKLTIKRDQADVKGLLGGHKGVKFKLYGRCEVSDEEKALIDKYKASEYVLAEYKVDYKGSPLEYTISVSQLVSGRTIELERISTLLDLEKAMKEGCRSLKSLLEVMASFGGEEVFEI